MKKKELKKQKEIADKKILELNAEIEELQNDINATEEELKELEETKEVQKKLEEELKLHKEQIKSGGNTKKITDEKKLDEIKKRVMSDLGRKK